MTASKPPGDATAPPPPKRRLWRRDFTILWLALLQSSLGDTFLAIGLMWLVLEESGSPLAAGTVLMLEGLPKLLGPLAGVVVDRSSKRLLMIGGDLVRGACLVLVFTIHMLGALALWHVYTLVVILGVAGLFYGPSLKVLLPTLVDDESLSAANSAVAMGSHLSTIAGGIVAGIALAVMGAPAALLIDGVSFFVAAGIIALIHIPEGMLTKRGLEAGAVLEDLIDGFRFILGRGEVLLLTLTIFVCNLVLSPVNVVFPLYSAEVLQAGVEGFGYLASAIGLGLLLGSALAGLIELPYVRAISLALFGLSAALVVFGLNTSLWLAIVLAAVVGILVPFVEVPVVSQLQRSVPRNFQGRTFATMNSVVAAATPIGAALAGQALAKSTIDRVFFGAAIGIALVGLTWAATRLRHASASPASP